MSNKTVSANELRKQSGKLLEACNRELERVNQAKEQLTALKNMFDELKALDGTVVEEHTDVSYGSTVITYTTVKTIADVTITDGGMAEAFSRFNTSLELFNEAREKLVKYCGIIHDSADEIEANNEAILDALLELGLSNTPVGNNDSTPPGSNDDQVPPSNNDDPVPPSNNDDPPPSNNDDPVPPSNNDDPVPPSNNDPPPPSNNDPPPPSNNDPPPPPSNNDPPPPPGPPPSNNHPTPTPTRTPTPTPTPSPTPTPTPTPTTSPTPTPTPTTSPIPTPTATGYEPIPYTGITDEKKNNLISSMAFPLGAAVAAAGVGAAIHEGISRYNEAREKKEEEEFDGLVDREDAVSRIKDREEPFTVEAARVAAEAGQSIRDSLGIKRGDDNK